MSGFRTESDFLGQVDIPAEALFGIHTQRARENFPLTGRPVQRSLVHAYGHVKRACAQTNFELDCLDAARFDPIEKACQELAAGALDQHIVVDALQGGAGTSTNMNVNEVIANRGLQLMGQPLGSYDRVHPIEHVNLHQSTNDTFPTALRVAAIAQLRGLEGDVTYLVDALQCKEHEFAIIVKVGRTQLQDAVLTTLGRSMGAFAEALARDRWRIDKCEERLRVVNLGGTAIGTGRGAPRQYIFRVVEHLRQITGLGLARAENMIDATQNADALVEVSGMVRTLACNLIKIANDLRLMASGPAAGLGEIRLPAQQAGSSIMPGKVNPVIPEAVCQAGLSMLAADQTLANACSQGNLELNHLMPLIADSLLGSLQLGRNTCRLFADRCVRGIQADPQRCQAMVETTTATVTALVDRIGYTAAEEVAATAAREGLSIRQCVLARSLMTPEQFDRAIEPEAVTRLGSPNQAGPP